MQKKSSRYCQSIFTVGSIPLQVDTVKFIHQQNFIHNWTYSIIKCLNVSLFRLIHDYSDLTQIIFAILFSWSITAMCVVMLMLNLKTVRCFWVILSMNHLNFILNFLIFGSGYTWIGIFSPGCVLVVRYNCWCLRIRPKIVWKIRWN